MASLLALARIACPPAMLLFITLRLFAHTHVADPSWIAGLYDADDADHLLDLVRVGYVAPDDTPAADDRAPLLVEEPVLSPIAAPTAAPVVRSHGPRAPPLPSLRVIGR